VLGIMQSPVWTLQASDSLKRAISLLGSARGRQSPVLKGEDLVGVLCNCDLSQLVSNSLREIGGGAAVEALDSMRIQDVVEGGAVSIGPYHSVVAAAQVLLERQICALPVVDERKVVGLVTRNDLLRALVNLVKELESRLAAP
jgi:predicted transcriptional regulator